MYQTNLAKSVSNFRLADTLVSSTKNKSVTAEDHIVFLNKNFSTK